MYRLHIAGVNVKVSEFVFQQYGYNNI